MPLQSRATVPWVPACRPDTFSWTRGATPTSRVLSSSRASLASRATHMGCPSVREVLSHCPQSPNAMITRSFRREQIRSARQADVAQLCALCGATLTCSGWLLPSPRPPCPSLATLPENLAISQWNKTSYLVILYHKSAVCRREITCWLKRRELLAALQQKAFFPACYLDFFQTDP